jgi:small-conductance mechanosensitive channel
MNSIMESSATPFKAQPFINRQEFLNALSTGDFYVEWLCIAGAVALAWLVAVLVRRRVHARLLVHPPKRIDSVFITRPLVLLAPVLAFIYLAVAKPFFRTDGGVWIEAVMQLVIAYFLARCAMLLVKTKFISYLMVAVIMITAVLNVTGFMLPVTTFLDSFAFEIGKFRLSLLAFIHGIVILILVFWLAFISASTLESYLRRSSGMSYNARELTVKFFRLFVYFVALLITLSSIGVDLTAFAVFGGALGVGIGLGLQKITSNFMSGITLLLEKSIKIGDLIEIGGIFGTVKALQVRYTLVETIDGRELMIPNEELISSKVISWTHSNNRARVEIPVGVAYGSDVDLVKKLLVEAALEHPSCMHDQEVKCWLREFADNSLNFLLAFWVSDVREGRYGPQSDVMCAILSKFKAHNIEIPFPQRVVYVKGQTAI